MGALDPAVVNALGSRIGNTNLRVDLYGDALGAAVLPNDRWRSAHDVFKQQIYLDAKFVGVEVKNISLRIVRALLQPSRATSIRQPQPGREAATDHHT
jgi:hypothetical protein